MLRCQMCFALDPKPVRTIQGPYDGLPYTLYQCRRCDSQLFDVDEHGGGNLEHFYDKRSRDVLPDFERDFTPSKGWRYEVDVIRALLPAPPRAVLDVGCRTGDFLLHWPDATERVGVEIAKPYAQIAEKRGIDVKNEPIEVAHFDRSEFDVVTCYAILEHLPQPRLAIGRLASLVAPGGCLVIMIPTFQSLKTWVLNRVGYRWHQYEPPEHLSLFSRRFLDGHLRGLGLQLADRRWTAGGMFNPFAGVRHLENPFGALMSRMDQHSPTRRLPIFDHMYSYYVRVE